MERRKEVTGNNQSNERPEAPPPHVRPDISRTHYGTLGVISFGLAVGVASALFVFALGIAAALFEWGVPLAAVLASLYIGFGPTFVGSISGAVWAFVDGFLFGIVVAWLYNRFLLRRMGPMP